MNAGPRHIPAEHLLVKKEQSGERLIPRGGGDVELGGKMAEKGAHLRFPRRGRMALAAPEDKALDPVNVRLLGTAAVMQSAYGFVHLLQQTWLFPTQGSRFCYIRHLTLEKQTNTTCIFVRHSDCPVFACFFRGA